MRLATLRRLVPIAATATAVVLAVVGAPTAAHAQSVPAPDDDPFYAVPADVGGLAAGALIRSRAITATALSVPLPAQAWQVLYRTTDNTGQPTATVATVMVPTAPKPGSGPRPVISYQTAEDGVGTKCAPSYAIRGGLASLSNSTPETLLMAQALARGFTVVAPDYEGPRSMFLGADGEARGVLDGLRAARAFAPAGIDPAAPLALWGYSGGAFASTVAAQLQPRYAPELKLAGVALGGVVADVRATIRAFSGSVFGGALVMGFVGVDRAYPEYRLTQYLNDAARKALANSQTDCITDAAAKYPGASVEQYTDDPGIIEGPELRPMFERMNPLTYPGVPAAPVYDYHAINDQLAPIGPDRALMERFCRGGARVQKVEDPLLEHLGLAATGAPGALDYLADRFAGKPAPNTCTLAPDPPTAPPATAACAAGAPKAPRATITRGALRTRNGRVSVRGRASTACRAGKPTPRVTRVTVSIARLRGTRCQFAATTGRLTKARSCRRPVALRATGTRAWSFSRVLRLPPGRYRIDVRATDAAGRTQPVARAASGRFTLR